MRTLSVLVVDDNFLMRKGLVHALEGVDGITVVGKAANGAEAVEWFRKSSADIVLMDVLMPIMGGNEATAEIVRICPQTKVLILTVIEEPYKLAQSIMAGAKGCLVYGSFSMDDLIQVIHSSTTSDKPIMPASVQRVLKIMGWHSDSSSQIPEGHAEKMKLSFREGEVFDLLMTGKSNKEIAESLCLEEQTVKNHLRHIYSKLNVRNRHEAIDLMRDERS
ncbi:MAG: response regulator transcription factor [Dehalococcoidia bacterium]|nr:response regulator transcription factor [Dehalococcoidia bacterium]